MKIALAHELLTVKGGAEKVARIFSEMFPDAPIFTLLYNEKKMSNWFPASRVRTPEVPLSPLPPLPASLFPNSLRYNHHLYLSQFARAVESFDFSEYDIVLSSSSAFMHGIITNSAPKHLCYVHSPARYLWDQTHDVLKQADRGVFGPLKRRYLERTFHKLRIWDAESAKRADAFLAASKAVQRRIECYWREESTVVYPPIDSFWHTSPLRKSGNAGYMLMVNRLSHYKRIDIAIDACRQAGVPLKIVGTGAILPELQAQAKGAGVEFLGEKSQEELRELYTHAIATLIPGNEDFGLVPIESMSCGTPVISYRAGGPLETILEGKTGAFFSEQTSQSLAETIKAFAPDSYSAEECRKQSENFSKVQFEKDLNTEIEKLCI